MVIRTKSGEYQAANVNVLLDFLGVKREAAGLHKVAGDVELIVPIQMKSSSEQVAGSSEPNPEGIAWTLSTFDLDRYQERIDPAGWDFAQFVKNPVVEWAHRYDIPAIGKIENLVIDDKGLHGLVFFNGKEYDPFGWSIGQRVKAGVIRAGSVGFRVMEIEIPDRETAKDGTSLIFRKQELLEFSICNVPANPFAIAKSSSREQVAGSINHSDSSIRFWDCLINNL